jgi:hypothetical protein
VELAEAARGAAWEAEKAELERAEAMAEATPVMVQKPAMDPDQDTAWARAAVADREQARARARGPSPA